MATGSFGDSFDTNREQHYTRAACAELLIDAGAVVTPSVCDGLIGSRSRGLLADSLSSTGTPSWVRYSRASCHCPMIFRMPHACAPSLLSIAGSTTPDSR